MTLALAACGGGGSSRALVPLPVPVPPPSSLVVLDLNDVVTANGVLRASGSVGTGRFGVPVAGGLDCDGDGALDFAMAAMLASPLGRVDAGQVFLIFGNGSTGQNIDTAVANTSVLQILGAGQQENTGSEIWIDDLTGDGLGDLIIGRQNYTGFGRIGAGAVSVVVGNQELAEMASRGESLDLAAPPAGVNIVTFVGAATLDRLGMWIRAGDVDGDGVADLAIGADQADTAGEDNAGTVFLIRGGVHLDVTATIDFSAFGSTMLAGQVAKLNPPIGASSYHFGASLSLGDLDDNGRAEVYVAAALNRSGGTLLAAGAPAGSAEGSGGNPGGSLFIFWDDNFPLVGTWPAGLTIEFSGASGSTTRIDGGTVTGVFSSDSFGEEILPGADYDGDGNVDLFVGDITGSPSGRSRAGLGHVIFSAAMLRNQFFNIASPPANIRVTNLLGPSAGAIFADTAAQGDFDGDGRIDLAIGSPHDAPLGRTDAGSLQILWGQANWPATVDLVTSARPSSSEFGITDIVGAAGGTSTADHGDTLMYSAATGDIDGDGRDDLIVNEMQGNGIASDALDVGNLLVIPGNIIPR